MPPLHPEIVPFSVANKKRSPPKSVVELKTLPVGAAVAVGRIDGGGMVTTIGLPTGNGCPLALYTVARPVPLSEIQNGPMGGNEIPQELTRFGSVTLARPATSDTKFVC